MPDIWNYFKNLFTRAEESSPSNPLIHEVIERSEEDKIAYNKWKDSQIKKRLINWLQDQYAVYLTNPDHIDEAVDFLETSSSNGFIIHFYQTHYSREEVTHLFDYLKEKTLRHNYKTYLSDRRTYQRQQWVESVQRHYLKPRPDFSRQRLDQLFGNVSIELMQRNEKVVHLKYSATHYSDNKYEAPQRFEKLMASLFHH